MKTVRLFILIACAAAGSALFMGTASAQATRTWVSGTGDDVNACSRSAPCKTFAGAISKTAASGEINCLDPGGFGAVTITKSITIDCSDTLGSVLAPGVTGITINGANIDVILRNLTINGAPVGTPGINGVRYLQGRTLKIENCDIFGFKGAAPNGAGIIVNNTSGLAKLTVLNSTLTGNGTASSGAGILLIPSGTGAVNATIIGSAINDNFNGLRADGSATSGIIAVSVSNSSANGNTQNGMMGFGAGPIKMTLSGVSSSQNGTNGIRSNGANTVVVVGGSTVTQNGTGFAADGGGQLVSFGDNKVAGNNSDGVPTSTIAAK